MESIQLYELINLYSPVGLDLKLTERALKVP